jgi:hypothetical protein
MKKEIETTELRDMIVYSFRYALGRQTYATSDMSNIIVKYWDDLREAEQKLIVKEIEQAIVENKAGWDIDIKSWQCVLAKGREFCRKPMIEDIETIRVRGEDRDIREFDKNF